MYVVCMLQTTRTTHRYSHDTSSSEQEDIGQGFAEAVIAEASDISEHGWCIVCELAVGD